MLYRKLGSTSCLVAASVFLCGPAHAADDAAAICNAAISAYEAGVASGDPRQAGGHLRSPDGELVSPFGVVSGHDALVKTFGVVFQAGRQRARDHHEFARGGRRGVVQRRLDLHAGFGRRG